MKTDEKRPAFYRQKIALALLEAAGGELTKLDFQKLLFVFSKEYLDKKSYDFVPYFYGCYSFQAQADMKTMQNYNLVSTEESSYIKQAQYSFQSLLKPNDQVLMQKFLRNFSLRGDDLIRYVYQKYPFYTVNSRIASKFLPENKPANNIFYDKSGFFTIGYEGKTFEQYINELIENHVDILFDVRKNPFSMKFGFNKHMMKKSLENIGITYIHLPELGIESEKRTELNSIEDYQLLFDQYETEVLEQSDAAKKAMALLIKSSQEKRIAITCFEKEITMCHRGRLVDFINRNDPLTIQHI